MGAEATRRKKRAADPSPVLLLPPPSPPDAPPVGLLALRFAGESWVRGGPRCDRERVRYFPCLCGVLPPGLTSAGLDEAALAERAGEAALRAALPLVRVLYAGESSGAVKTLPSPRLGKGGVKGPFAAAVAAAVRDGDESDKKGSRDGEGRAAEDEEAVWF